MLIAWFIFCCSNKLIALKKVIEQMVRKHTLNDVHNHIMEFKKRKSAQKPTSWPQASKRFTAESAALFWQVKADKMPERNASLARHFAPDKIIF